MARPLDIRDPLEMFKAVAYRTRIMKGAGAADLVADSGVARVSAPALAISVLAKHSPSLVPLPLPLLNMICTNMPGSPVVLYSTAAA